MGVTLHVAEVHASFQNFIGRGRSAHVWFTQQKINDKSQSSSHTHTHKSNKNSRVSQLLKNTGELTFLVRIFFLKIHCQWSPFVSRIFEIIDWQWSNLLNFVSVVKIRFFSRKVKSLYLDCLKVSGICCIYWIVCLSCCVISSYVY